MTLPAPKQTARAAQHDDFDDTPFTFRPATKDQVKARVALHGISGSGKTWTSLALARSLGEPFAVIDTERGAASKYVGVNGLKFDVLQMAKYDPRDLARALAAAAKAGYPVVVIDSLTHFWKGAEGTLDQVDKAKSRYGGNSFGGWKEGTPMQNDMVDALLSYPGHVIATMRSHTEWVLEENDRGKREPVAKGTRPEQRKGIEYEFDLVGQMDVANTLTVIKSRCPALHERVMPKPDGAAIGKELLDWLNDGAEPVDPTAYIDSAEALASYDAALDLYREVETHGLLATPYLNGDEPTSLGEFIKTRGTELKTN